MDFNSIKEAILHFVQEYQFWAPFVVACLAFGESLAIISLFCPATIVLFAIGFLVGQGELAFFPLWIGAITGTFIGDILSYKFGSHYKERVFHLWPIHRYPKLIEQGHHFFRRWGIVSVFLGRFFGPVRSVITLIAGIFEMPKTIFLFSCLISAGIWAFTLLAPGWGIMKYMS